MKLVAKVLYRHNPNVQIYVGDVEDAPVAVPRERLEKAVEALRKMVGDSYQSPNQHVVLQIGMTQIRVDDTMSISMEIEP